MLPHFKYKSIKKSAIIKFANHSKTASNVVLLSTAYLPPVEYIAAICRYPGIIIEGCESYQKQSYRNRCRIMAADGPLVLSVPVGHSEGKGIRDIRIDYTRPWIQQHTRAIISAYGNAPFFEYYKDELLAELRSGEPSLFELNMKLLKTITEGIGLHPEISVTSEYRKEWGSDVVDLRETIHPKRPLPESLTDIREYYQVFSNRLGFVPGLSSIDLLFNEGPDAESKISNRTR